MSKFIKDCKVKTTLTKEGFIEYLKSKDVILVVNNEKRGESKRLPFPQKA